MSDDEPNYKPTPVSMPAQPTTKQLPAMTDRALLEDMFRLMKEQDKKVDNVALNLDLLGGEFNLVKQDVHDLKVWKVRTEDRQNRYSGGARQLSESDSKQDATIASLVVGVTEVKAEQAAARTRDEEAKKRDEAQLAAVAENTAITVEFKRTLLSGARHPAVIALALAALGYATHWLMVHT